MSNSIHQTLSYSFRLPIDLKGKMDKAAKKRGQTKSGFLRIAIEAELRRTAQQESGGHEAL
jgi:predicted DNA-binding protein